MSPTRRNAGAGASPGETVTCPWCSATVSATASTCPSCGAALRDSADGDVLGVTSIDPTAYSRLRRIKPRGNRITKWLTGGDDVLEEESGGSVAPPSAEVKREMLRLELAALNAEIEAKEQAAAANRDLPPDDGTDRSSPPKGAAPG